MIWLTVCYMISLRDSVLYNLTEWQYDQGDSVLYDLGDSMQYDLGDSVLYDLTQW